jgi:hypothetical protein
MESEEVEGIDAASKIWGNLLNKEQMRVLGLDGPPAGSNKRHKPDQQKKKKDTRSNSEASTTVPTSLLVKLSKLVLRHEDSINVMLQESEFILHLNPGKGSVLPLLLQTSRTWHQNSQDRQMPLRHLLARTMMQTLEARTKILMEAAPTEDLFQDCVQYHLVVNNQDRTMPFLRWDSKHRCLQPTEAPGIPIAVAYKNVCSIVRLMSDSSVTLRFHALRKMQEGQDAQQPVPWLWTLSLRNSPELQQQLAALSHHAIWQLIQVRLKPQTLTRQPLATQIQKAL